MAKPNFGTISLDSHRLPGSSAYSLLLKKKLSIIFFRSIISLHLKLQAKQFWSNEDDPLSVVSGVSNKQFSVVQTRVSKRISAIKSLKKLKEINKISASIHQVGPMKTETKTTQTKTKTKTKTQPQTQTLIVCPMCPEMYTSTEMVNHVKYFHENNVKSHQCTARQCTLVSVPSTSTAAGTSVSARVPACVVPQRTSGMQEQLMQCSNCPKIFTNPGYLVAHFKEFHKVKSEKQIFFLRKL
jgi:hypothetical protein